MAEFDDVLKGVTDSIVCQLLSHSHCQTIRSQARESTVQPISTIAATITPASATSMVDKDRY